MTKHHNIARRALKLYPTEHLNTEWKNLKHDCDMVKMTKVVWWMVAVCAQCWNCQKWLQSVSDRLQHSKCTVTWSIWLVEYKKFKVAVTRLILVLEHRHFTPLGTWPQSGKTWNMTATWSTWRNIIILLVCAAMLKLSDWAPEHRVEKLETWLRHGQNEYKVVWWMVANLCTMLKLSEMAAWASQTGYNIQVNNTVQKIHAVTQYDEHRHFTPKYRVEKLETWLRHGQNDESSNIAVCAQCRNCQKWLQSVTDRLQFKMYCQSQYDCTKNMVNMSIDILPQLGPEHRVEKVETWLQHGQHDETS